MALIQTLGIIAGILVLLTITLVLVTGPLADFLKSRGVPIWIGAPVVFALSLLFGLVLLGFVSSFF